MEYYLTIRMSLMDYTSGHSFWVQNAGDSAWSSPSIGVTGDGSDNNGATKDICIQVPSENCVVRGSMYVEPMGRDVVFYLYPSDYSEGNNTNMSAAMVTAASGSSTETTGNGTGNAESSTENSGDNNKTTVTPSALKSEVSLSGSDKNSETVSEDSQSQEEPKKLESSIKEAVSPVNENEVPSAEGKTLNGALGLSLSTQGEKEAASASVAAGGMDAGAAGRQILVLVVSITISGLILLAAVSGVIFLFRRNWYRWGGREDE